MKTIIFITSLLVTVSSISAVEREIFAQLKNEVTQLVDSAGDVWAYSGNGGYAFEFTKDVLGDNGKEKFVNFSLRPNVWYVFSSDKTPHHIGQIEFPSFDFIISAKNKGQTRIFRAYSADSYAKPPFEPFGKYVLEQVISQAGVQHQLRTVGKDATAEEFDSLKYRNFADGTAWAKPNLQATLLHDLLTKESSDWFKLDTSNIQLRNGYFRLPDDQKQISEFERTFTPKAALRLLNQKLNIQDSSHETPTSASTTPLDRTTAPPSTPKETPIPPPLTEKPTPPAETPEAEKPNTLLYVLLGLLLIAVIAIAAARNARKQ